MIGKQIKELRKGKHMTQVELSEYLNVGQSTLANFENGKRPIPIDIIIELSAFFNVSTDYLLGVSSIPNVSCKSSHESLLTDEENKLIETFRCLNADERQIVLGKALDLKLSTNSFKKKEISS
jgi:transcriptional regulator with XRE-family HTH domain